MVQIVSGAGVVPVRVLELAKGVQDFDFLERELYDESRSVDILWEKIDTAASHSSTLHLSASHRILQRSAG